MTTQTRPQEWPPTTQRLRCKWCNGKHHANLVPKTAEPIKAIAYWKCRCGEYNAVDLETLC